MKPKKKYLFQNYLVADFVRQLPDFCTLKNTFLVSFFYSVSDTLVTIPCYSSDIRQQLKWLLNQNHLTPISIFLSHVNSSETILFSDFVTSSKKIEENG